MGSVPVAYQSFQIMIAAVLPADITVIVIIVVFADFSHMSAAGFDIANVVCVFILAKPGRIFSAVFVVADMVVILVGAEFRNYRVAVIAEMVAVFGIAGMDFLSAFFTEAIAIIIGMLFNIIISAFIAPAVMTFVIINEIIPIYMLFAGTFYFVITESALYPMLGFVVFEKLNV